VVERIAIDHVGHRGDGVAFVDDESVYVPYTLSGETAEVEKVTGHPDRRRLLRIVSASPQRIAPFCPHFATCGGCAIQHWQADAYRAWKRNIVVETLAQAKLDCAVAPLIDAHGLGRRRITLHARIGTHEVLKVGFTAAHSHDIIPVDRCPILDPALAGALDAAWAIAEPLVSIGKPLDVQITATDNGLDVDVRGSGPLPAAMIARLSGIAEQHRLARLTRHGELVLLRRPPVITIGAAQITLPPGSFLQATLAGEATLAALVAEHAGHARHIADLFCGLGNFSLPIATRAAQVVGFEGSRELVERARQNAVANRLVAQFEVLNLFENSLFPFGKFEKLLLDPPREGAIEIVKSLPDDWPRRIVYVSCDQATLARDAGVLVHTKGFRLAAAGVVNMFPHTAHVESIAVFER